MTEWLGSAASEIVKLVPELAALLPGLIPSPPLDPEQEKRRLFHAPVQMFSHLAASQPLLTVFEDLHWSDGITLEFLLQLARASPSSQF